MKKIILGLLLVTSLSAAAQPLTDTGAVRAYINAHIVPNGTRSITAQQLNTSLNGILNVFGTTPTLQQVFSSGTTLTGNNTINNGTKVLTITSTGAGLIKLDGLSHDTTQAIGVEVYKADSSIARMSWKQAGPIMLAQSFAGETYIPTLTNTTNISASSLTPGEPQIYTRNFNIVHQKLVLRVTPTAANTLCELTVGLPYTVTIPSVKLGTGVYNPLGSGEVHVLAELASPSTAVLRWTPQNTTQSDLIVTLDYIFQ